MLETEPTKYVVEWKRKSSCKCSWRLRAIKDPCLASFRIVRYNGPHASNCVGDINSIDHHLFSSDFVCSVIKDLIRADPLKIHTIVQGVKDKFQYTITYKRAWSAKQKAIASIFGDWEKSYKRLPNYMQTIKESTGTVVERFTQREGLCVISDRQARILQTMNEVNSGWEEPRSHYRFCTCYLAFNVNTRFKNAYVKKLFGKAADVRQRKKFDYYLGRVGELNVEGLYVISDRHVGILQTMNEVNSGWEEPRCHHRFCTRHLASNVNTQFKNAYVKNLFGKAADARQ
ncbi:uncharacterized protein [Spinacia oleracea]|uniref:MULE transposase domain-containing protein n=1 Tax=Spinacia oleracea TaxID=3562 RepID=A0ABM3QXG8_SPIOL|nr:uncharacterized protein LOC130463055 [Spinacia oleracea]